MERIHKRGQELAFLSIVVGAAVFLSSLFFNYATENEFVGDLLELLGTVGLVGSGCLIVRMLSRNAHVWRAFYAAALALCFARLLDLTGEIRALNGLPILGGAGFAQGATLATCEAIGYILAFFAMIALLFELSNLKDDAEAERHRYRELHEASLRLARVADMSAEAVFGCDREGRVRVWTRGAQNLFGYDGTQAVGLKLTDLLVEGLSEADGDFARATEERGPMRSIEATACDRSGRRFPAEVSVSPVRDEGDPLGVSVIVRNVEKRKRAEADLTASRNLLLGALQNADIGMFLVADNWELIELNNRLLEITGLTRPLPSLRELYERVIDSETKFAETIRDRVFKGGHPIEIRNLAAHRPNGTTRICHVAVTPVLENGSKVVAAVGIVVDVTEREALQAKLLESQKMEAIGRLAGGVAHDFNNILSGILGYASLLGQKLEPDSPFQRYAQAIEESAVRAADLTNQLLAFSRGGSTNFVTTDLNNLISESLKLVTPSLKPNVQVTFTPGGDLGYVAADKAQMHQLVMNLCLNASDAMDGEGTVRIETAEVWVDEALRHRLAVDHVGPHFMLVFKDTGHGMSADVIQRIFDPFFSTRDQKHGYGLGLSVVYAIVREHKGGILVDSDPGKGTRFSIYIPMRDTATPITEEGAPPSTGEDRSAPDVPKVLVVDDEQLFRALLDDVLSTEGYEAIKAASGEEGIEAYRERREEIGLVVMDLVMPGMGGARALEHLREMNPALPCIVVTGHAPESVDTAKFTDTCTRFVAKPFRPKVLTALIHELIDDGQEPEEG